MDGPYLCWSSGNYTEPRIVWLYRDTEQIFARRAHSIQVKVTEYRIHIYGLEVVLKSNQDKSNQAYIIIRKCFPVQQPQ